MHEDIKKYADERNTQELKYRFNNSLDIDPTFEKYIDDFEYCKTKNAFEKHKKLTPLEVNNTSNWNDIYWANLKKDLFENFSQKRLEHMIKVAKVIYKDKIERLIEERQQSKEEETKYTKVTSELTEAEKAIEKQENEKKITEQKETGQNELAKTNEAIETAIKQKQDELDKGKEEAKITSSLIKKENEKAFIKDGLMVVGSGLLLGLAGFAGKMLFDNINSKEKKSIRERVKAILHSKKISPNEKIVRLENIKDELSDRLNSSNNEKEIKLIENHISEIDKYIKSLKEAERFIDENTIE